MVSIIAYSLKDGSRRYYVKYRSADHRQHRKNGFRTKKAAQDYAARIVTSVNDGDYIDPQLGKVSVGRLAATWLEGKKGAVKPKYWGDLESSWRVHVAPKWGKAAGGRDQVQRGAGMGEHHGRGAKRDDRAPRL